MRNARSNESQARIKTAGRNINNFSYVDDNHPNGKKMKRKSLLMKVKEESEKKNGLELSIQKTKIMASSPITSWQIKGEKVETVTNFIFLGSRITVDSG